MKRKTGRILLLTALLAAGAMMLTACTQGESSGSADSGSQSTADSTQTVSGSVVSESTQAADSAQGTAGVSSSDSAQENAGSSDQADATSDGPVGDVIPDEYADAAEAENQADDVWSGTYVSDSESVSVTLVNDETISFSFAQSGISGTASVNGSQAVFNGDDYHVVVFSLNGTVLNIAVSSEEDFDASGSPLNGTYVRSEG